MLRWSGEISALVKNLRVPTSASASGPSKPVSVAVPVVSCLLTLCASWSVVPVVVVRVVVVPVVVVVRLGPIMPGGPLPGGEGSTDELRQWGGSGP